MKNALAALLLPLALVACGGQESDFEQGLESAEGEVVCPSCVYVGTVDRADRSTIDLVPTLSYRDGHEFIVYVTNRGNTTAPASTTQIRIWNYRYDLPTPAIAPGATQLLIKYMPSTHYNTLAGVYISYTVTADYGAQIAETNEANNTIVEY